MRLRRDLVLGAAGAFLLAGEAPGGGNSTEAYGGPILGLEDLAPRIEREIACRIDEATDGFSIGPSRTSWVSQPGVITTFSNQGTSYANSIQTRHLLYSAAGWIEPRGPKLSDDLDSDWDLQLGRYVDLNAPVDVGGVTVSPIIPAELHPDHSVETPEGFDYSTTIDGRTINGVVEGQSLPMPVQWLYVLRNGALAPMSTSGLIVPWRGSISPDNPIVGRIAFWTDDLSSKVNVNTASEGVYWDPPRADNLEERAFAARTPGSREWQRHPGHPAMVSMSSILAPGRRYYAPGDSGDLPELSLQEAAQFWAATPGVASGEGTIGGTVDAPLVPEADVDPPHWQSLADFPYSSERAIGDYEFFLTTDSSAPEETFAGFPRVSTWPLPAQNDVSDNRDLAMQEASTVGPGIFAFRRSTNDLHSDFYELDGGHNQVLLEQYLIGAFPTRLPASQSSINHQFGGASLDGDLHQWLVLAHDQILSTETAPYDPQLDQAGTGMHSPSCQCGGPSVHSSRWQTPSFPAKGIGRLPTVSEVGIVFFCTAYKNNDGTGEGAEWETLEPGERRVRVALVLEAFCPRHGVTSIVPDGAATIVSNVAPGGVTGSPVRISVNNTRMSPPDPTTVKTPRSANDLAEQDWAGGNMGLRVLSSTTAGSMEFETTAGDPYVDISPFFGATIQVSFDTLMQVVLFDSEDGADVAHAHQRVDVQFPAAFAIPIPAYSSESTWAERLEMAESDPGALIRPEDVVRSMVLSHGDSRLLASTRVVPRAEFAPHPAYTQGTPYHAHSLTLGNGEKAHGFSEARELVVGAGYPSHLVPDLPISPSAQEFARLAQSPPQLSLDPTINGEFATGLANTTDGALIDLIEMPPFTNGEAAYFDRIDDLHILHPHHQPAPQLMCAGPGTLGGLPTRVRSRVPWRTALFRPDPDRRDEVDVADYWFLDHFRTPVVEPRLSTNLATEGKINLNYRIEPFGHIHRSTALHALMKAEKQMAIPTNAGPAYKSRGNQTTYRYYIDAAETLQQWENKFDDNELFITEGEICEQYLVPEGQQLGNPAAVDRYPAMESFWNNHKLTGDNVRERPYTALHNRLCVRSNWYETHYWVQSIEMGAGSDPERFDPAVDIVTGSKRGSFKVERQLEDPDQIPAYQFGQVISKPSLSSLFRAQIVERKTFAPTPSGFGIASITAANEGQIAIRWHSSPGGSYLVQRSIDGGTWADISPALSASGLTRTWVDQAPPAEDQVLYRVAELP